MFKKNYRTDLTCLMQQDVEITQRPISGYLSRTPSGAVKFEQTVSREKRYERNPHIFEGDYINIGRNKEGDIVLNFRKIKDADSSFDPKLFCQGVYQELLRELPTILNQ